MRSRSKAGSGTLTLTGNDTYSGATTVNAGTLAIGAGGSIRASSSVSLAGTNTVLDISGGGNQLVQELSGVGSSQVLLGANTLFAQLSTVQTFAGTISGTGGLTKLGPGTLALSGNNTYSGGTEVNAGTLNVQSNSALGTAAVGLNDGATLQAGSNVALANNVLLNGSETIDTQAFAATLSALISGSSPSASKIVT